MTNRKFLLHLALIAILLPASLYASTQVIIFDGDPPNVGFNDPTPVVPVGGNPGTTLGDQRIFAYLAAADKWGSTLDSDAGVTVLAV